VEKSGPNTLVVPSPDGVPVATIERALAAFRGNHPARVDSKGRLKIPNGFLALLRAQFGSDLFVTSVTGEYVRLYPMPVWLEVERRLATVPSTSPAKNRFLDRVNFFGQLVTIDRQGRVLLPQILRETAATAGDVCVLGLHNHLAVWSQGRLKERLFKREPFTDEDGRILAEYGI
jgi:MraZ protein